jgi:hypothetical protein
MDDAVPASQLTQALLSSLQLQLSHADPADPPGLAGLTDFFLDHIAIQPDYQQATTGAGLPANDDWFAFSVSQIKQFAQLDKIKVSRTGYQKPELQCLYELHWGQDWFYQGRFQMTAKRDAGLVYGIILYFTQGSVGLICLADPALVDPKDATKKGARFPSLIRKETDKMLSVAGEDAATKLKEFASGA